MYGIVFEKMMIHILSFVVYLLSSHVSLKVDGIQTTLKEDLDLERQLELVNKPPTKSIHVCLNFVMFYHTLSLVDITLHGLIILFLCFILDLIDGVWRHC